nr:hypothetical protein [Tissierella sp.]
MKKFMKYEIKGTYKFMLGILAVIVLASSMIQYNILKQMNMFDNPSSFGPNGFTVFIFILSVLVIFGAFITAFFYIVNSFKKELYEDRGYLTFTLPLTGNQILGSKLLVAIMWNTVIGAVAFLYNLLLAMILFKGEVREVLQQFFTVLDISFITTVATSIVGAMLTLILVYFSISLSKVSIGNKKIGGMWFIIFLIISGVTGYITASVGEAIPYFLDINTFKIIPLEGVEQIINNTFSGMGMSGFGDMAGAMPGFINLASFGMNILFAVLFFMGTGYLIEHRVEL